MTKKILRQFAEQFGKDWRCSCRAPFGVANLDIVSESDNSLVAHYVCPECGREQMLAASISSDRTESTTAFAPTQLTADDVLDIRDEIRSMKQAAVRALARPRVRPQKQHLPKTA